VSGKSGGAGLVAGSVWHKPVVREADKDALAKRQAQAAVTLLHLGATARVWPFLNYSSDQRVRTFLIHRFAALRTDPLVLLRRLELERDVSRRRALVLSLGSYSPQGLEPQVRRQWLARLRKWYREEPDAGLHGAVEWLLRRWGEGAKIARMEEEMAAASRRSKRVAGGDRPWYVNGEGQTLVVIPQGTVFWMGSPGTDVNRLAGNEPLHQVRIRRAFAIAAKEVTVAQFLAFDPDHRYLAWQSKNAGGPIINVSWFKAAEYCNWLSEREGIPRDQWCYLPNAQGKYDDGMQLAPGYLSKIGYRLPTEAEWEYACRAGTETVRYYGNTKELLEEYAWYTKTTEDAGVRPGGLLKPNDWGLFDMYGNAIEWVQNWVDLYRWRRQQPSDDVEGYLPVHKAWRRLMRGGAFERRAAVVRSAGRSQSPTDDAQMNMGFRVARTHR
jgi:formylglycine-generating enzyme required for sulfatase activity